MRDNQSISRRLFLTLAAATTGTAVQAQTPATSTGPVTLLFSMTVKPERMEEFATVVQNLTTTTLTQDAGCIAYVFLQQEDNLREYVLYEQWRDRAALGAHLARLQKIFGPSPSGRGLPPGLLNFFETTRTVRYRLAS